MLCSLNAEQLQFVHQPNGHGKLLGIPGGGKTSAVLARIVHTIDTGNLRGSFMVTAFSKAAQRSFVEKGAKLRKKVFNNRNVRTVHSLASSVIKKTAKINTSVSVQTIVYRANQECQKLLSEGVSLRTVHKDFRKIQTILVDEAQDISEVQYKFIMSFARTLDSFEGVPVSVVMVGDPCQNIYQFQGGSDVHLLNHPGFEVSLTRNYRSTEHLVRLINAVRPIESLVPMDSEPSDSPGDKPILCCGSEEEVAAHLLDRVRDILGKSDDSTTIAIVGPVKKCVPTPSGPLNIGLQYVGQKLRDAGIPFEVHYTEDSDDRATGGRKTDKFLKPKIVHLMTIHMSKGLEFDHVLVVNYHLSTMTRVPKSVEEIDAYRRLWYVALSRAKKTLAIYCLDYRAVWQDFHDRSLRDLFELPCKIPQVHRALQLQDVRAPPSRVRWTDVLQKRDLFGETALAQLEDTWELSPRSLEPLPGIEFDSKTELLVDEENLSTLYGMWAEEVFYHSYTGSCPSLAHTKLMLECTIRVPREYAAQSRIFKDCHDLSDVITWDEFEKTPIPKWCLPLSKLIRKWRNEHPLSLGFLLHVENDVQWYDIEVLEEMVLEWKSSSAELTASQIWKIVLFKWQYDHEAGYRWHDDYTEHMEELDRQGVYHRVRGWAKSQLPSGFVFQQSCKWSHLNVHGIADAVSTMGSVARVIELKFSSQPLQSQQGAIQAAGYAEMLFGPTEASVELWNLRNGERLEVGRNTTNEKRWELTCCLARHLNMELCNTCWLYDLETTGLDTDHCGITEIHMQELGSELVPISTLVFQPRVPTEVTMLTGITSKMLLGRPDEIAVLQKVQQILDLCSSPIMIAHNGHKFDNAIMKSRISNPLQTAWKDSMHLFCALTKNDEDLGGWKSKKLSSMYTAITGRDAGVMNMHRAKGDVKMMDAIFKRLGVSSPQVFQMTQVF